MGVLTSKSSRTEGVQPLHPITPSVQTPKRGKRNNPGKSTPTSPITKSTPTTTPLAQQQLQPQLQPQAWGHEKSKGGPMSLWDGVSSQNQVTTKFVPQHQYGSHSAPVMNPIVSTTQLQLSNGTVQKPSIWSTTSQPTSNSLNGRPKSELPFAIPTLQARPAASGAGNPLVPPIQSGSQQHSSIINNGGRVSTPPTAPMPAGGKVLSGGGETESHSSSGELKGEGGRSGQQGRRKLERVDSHIPQGTVVEAQPRVSQGPLGREDSTGSQTRAKPSPTTEDSNKMGLGGGHWQQISQTRGQASFQLSIGNLSAVQTPEVEGAERQSFVYLGFAGRGFSSETLDGPGGSIQLMNQQKENAGGQGEQLFALAKAEPENHGQSAAMSSMAIEEAEDAQDAMQSEFRDLAGRKWMKSSEIVGAGGFGKVFLGMDERGRLVAMKVVEGMRPETCTEIRYLESLEHPNIVQYLGTIRCRSNNLIIVMEYVATGSLAALIKKFRCLTPLSAARYARDILAGLAYLHENKIVHRDIKPHNVLVDSEGRCKLTDFGTARMDSTMTTKSSVAGTPMYISPEALGGKSSYASDIWSLGLMLAEMLTGEHPYAPAVAKMSAPSPIAIMFHIAQHDPVIRAAMPDVARNFILSCLTREPDQRPTAHQLLNHPWLTA